MARAAEHRLRRGIWTSPGAGDIRRATSACERLVLLADAAATSAEQRSAAASQPCAGAEVAPWERRDLAVLYALRGDLVPAKVELEAYCTSAHFRACALADRALVERLQELLRPVEVPAGARALSVASVLETRPPDPAELAPLPLPW